MKQLAGAEQSIEIFDTTLRDGAQGKGISFSVRDKLAAAAALDELGVSWIEAGNPGSNPKDAEFFTAAAGLRLSRARLCAFGSTRKKGVKAREDAQLRSLLDAGTEAAAVFGKASALHVRGVLKVSLEENLDMIAETVGFLRDEGRTVLFDAEHFFDGLREDSAYALKCLRAAFEAGAARLILCDTNGGSFPDAVASGVKAALQALDTGVLGGAASSSPPAASGPGTPLSPEGAGERRLAPTGVIGGSGALGIHAHNDSGLAVAVSLAAVEAGCVQVQGTLLGIGERCGNACLAAVIPNLELKLGRRCLPEGRLSRLSEVCRRVAEISNSHLDGGTPYVGSHAFSHKAGMHADAIIKMRSSFEHVDPALVGNGRHFLMSEQGGRAAIAERVKDVDAAVGKGHPAIAALSRRLKALEAEGWAFDGADASFEILTRKELGSYRSFFEIIAFRVQSEHPAGKMMECCHAWVKVLVDGQCEMAAAEGDGPVNALDGALRRALTRFYPELARMRLSDYKVRVIDGKAATAAKVRVLIESTDGAETWATVGVSPDIIRASCLALTDSIEYRLISIRPPAGTRALRHSIASDPPAGSSPASGRRTMPSFHC